MIFNAAKELGQLSKLKVRVGSLGEGDGWSELLSVALGRLARRQGPPHHGQSEESGVLGPMLRAGFVPCRTTWCGRKPRA